MAGSLNFGIDILAKISGASQSTSALQQMQAAMQRTAGQIRALEAAQKHLGGTNTQVGNTLNGLKSKLASQVQAFSQLSHGAQDTGAAFTAAVAKGTVMGNMLSKIGSLALSAAKRLGQLAIAAGQKLFSAIRDHENLQTALIGYTGSTEKGIAALDALTEVANGLGVKVRDLAPTFQEFIGTGFTTEAALEMTKFQADMIAFAGSTPQMQDKIRESFTKLADAVTVGKFELENLKGIMKVLPIEGFEALAQVLGPKIGKSAKDTLTMLQKNLSKIPVDKLLESLQEATLAGMGTAKAGEFAANKTKTTFTGALDAIAARADNALGVIASKLGTQLFARLGPTIDAIGGMFDTPEFYAMIESVVSGVMSFVELLQAEAPNIKELFAGLAPVFQTLGTVLLAMVPMFGALAGGIGKALQALDRAGLFNAITTVFVFLAGTIEYLADVFGALADAMAPILDLIGTLVSVFWNGIGALLSIAYNAVAEFFGAGQSIGGGFIDGLVSQIKAGAQWVKDALKSILPSFVVNALPESTFAPAKQSAFSVPSTPTAGQGRILTVEERLAKKVGNPNVAPSGPVNNTTTISPNVTINVTGQIKPEEIAAQVEARLVGVFSSMAPT